MNKEVNIGLFIKSSLCHTQDEPLHNYNITYFWKSHNHGETKSTGFQKKKKKNLHLLLSNYHLRVDDSDIDLVPSRLFNILLNTVHFFYSFHNFNNLYSNFHLDKHYPFSWANIRFLNQIKVSLTACIANFKPKAAVVLICSQLRFFLCP